MDAKAEAGKHFDRGFALAKQGVYAEAVVEFNRAYELSRTSPLSFAAWPAR